MNTKNLKSYAPKARRQFIDAVTKRAAYFGIYEDGILPVTFEGSVAIIDGKPFPKKIGKQRQLLEKKIAETGFAQFVSEIAYTWFNRLAAIRYMELHDYLDHGFRVLSHPTNADGLPEVLDHAADVAGNLNLDKAHIIELQLAGDKQEELYRELLLGQCHYLHSIMPFLFEALDDATELLLPDNLTKTDSILKGLISDIPEEDWQQIEVIGWLYQFYISEHKDAVIGKVVKSEDIPAATQLFTPNWIVKYLVQNSIGRQWLATYPNSSIKEKMEYYIEPAEQTDEVNAQLAAITPSSIDPESIKALDPAAGSGHILVEIYELLREIYLERGYRLREIPELILTKNICGLDIDDRAAQLAGFALMMKAREDDRRIFQRVQDGSVKLNVYALQSTDGWDSASLWQALNLDGKAKQGSSGDLFVETKKFDVPTGEYAEYFDLLKYLIVSFEQAKTLGSLIQIDHQYLPTLESFKAKLQDKLQDTDPAAIAGAEQLLPVVEQAIVLAQKYDAVIANPPYMGSKGMNATLKNFAKEKFPNSKSDLFAIFMERAFALINESGHNAQINMQSWMFLSSYEVLREKILNEKSIITMAHLGARAFGQISGEVVQTTAWVLCNANIQFYQPAFFRLIDGNEEEKRFSLSNNENRFDQNSQSAFKKLPGSPLAYWLSSNICKVFEYSTPLSEYYPVNPGIRTGKDELFLRFWFEVSADNSQMSLCSSDEMNSNKKWFPMHKGGSFRKWYGNAEHIIDLYDDAQNIRTKSPDYRLRDKKWYFQPYVSWSRISTADISFRYFEKGVLFSDAGPGIFAGAECEKVIALLNSKLGNYFLGVINPTLNYQKQDVEAIPYIPDFDSASSIRAVEIAKADWDSYETSWDFKSNPLVDYSEDNNLSKIFRNIRQAWNRTFEELKDIEEANNEILINTYGLQKELTTEVANEKIALTCNPYYRYGVSKSESEIENFLQCDTVIELLSYSMGSMIGRYSLDKEGIVYAHAGNKGFKELVEEGTYKTFPADDDGIIPLASEEWLFEDDATARFREFVKTVWGEEHLQENLEFVAESLCLYAIKSKKGEGAMDTIRRYFSEKFFAEHCKMYKKRPIYWLFSSGKEKAFECLVYLHRYNESTLSRMRTEYVTPLMGKYESQYSLIAEQVSDASGAEQRKLEKELKSLEKKQAELRKFDEELKHYAEMRISLDLDDGVKVNYGKFGNLLANVKDIHGKAVK